MNIDKLDKLARKILNEKGVNTNAFGYQFKMFVTYFNLDNEYFSEFFDVNIDEVKVILEDIYHIVDEKYIAKERLIILKKITNSYLEADLGNFENYMADELNKRITKALKNKNTLKLKNNKLG